MPIYGSKSPLGLVFQTAFDTIGDISNSNTNIPYISETLTTNMEDLFSETIDGIYNEKCAYRGKQSVGGDIEFEVGAKSTGKVFGAMLPKNSSTASGSMYTHEFLPRAAQDSSLCWNKPLTFFKGSNAGAVDEQNLYNLCGTVLELSLDAGGFLMSKLTVVGGINNETFVTGANSYYSSDENFTWDNSSVSIDGQGFKATAIGLNFTDPIEPQYTIASSYWPRSNNLTGFRDVTFTVSLPWNNNSDYTRFFNATTGSDADLTLSCRGVTEIQSGYYNTVSATLKRVVYETLEASAGGPGEVELAITGRAQFDETAGYTAKLELINLETGAAY